MLYEITHFIKERSSFLWDFVEWGNALVFSMSHKRKLAKLDDILSAVSTEYVFRIAKETDVYKLLVFFKEQSEDAFEFFRPHEFDVKSIKKIVKNKAFLTFVVLKDDVIVGYFFLRCFVNGKCFRGKMVHKDWQGRGIAKLMGRGMTKVSDALGIRMFGSISPDNFASMASAMASNEIKVLKTLNNGYFYIEFLPKK